ncbi:MAG: purine-nucleoside phosphorylase [Candidatus Caenarcaniphilales bacterium]|nr:purine-nucleoside phosphorylase [Candidatus Caenarcaniphilales bacterium]
MNITLQNLEAKALNSKEFDKLLSFLKDFLSSQKPDLAIILGSGISFDLPLSSAQSISYQDLPGMPQTSVKGHKGKLVFGKTASGKKILIFSGRYHLYEGLGCEEVQLPVKIIHSLGCKNILLTNSAGGIQSELKVADLMIIEAIKDYQNDGKLNNPRGLLDCLEKSSLKLDTKLTQEILIDSSLKTGAYAAVLGPNYETLSEISLFKYQDCSAVGMSTYLEAKFALEKSLNVAAVSVITNIWNDDSKPTHKEVLENSSKAKVKMNRLFERIVSLI